MEHNRCAQCRNPIRGRQAMVRLARADMSFHADCWAILNLNVQREYELRAQDEGLTALLGPYNRAEPAAWLPGEVEGAEEAVEVGEDVGQAEPEAPGHELEDPADAADEATPDADQRDLAAISQATPDADVHDVERIDPETPPEAVAS